MGFIKKVGSFLKNELRLDRRDWFFMTGISTIFVGIVSLSITKFSLWYDEAFSAYMIRFDYFDIAKLSIFDIRSPIYYWVLKAWSGVFGNSELALRSLSLVFGVLCILTAYIFMKYITNRRVAVFAGIILIISPMLIRYSGETRMYTMMIFLSILSTLLLVIADRKKDNKSLWQYYGFVSGLSILIQYMSVFILIAHWLWRHMSLKNDKSQIFFSQGWIESIKYLLLSIVLWLPFMISQFFVVQDNGFWLKEFNLGSIIDFFSRTVLFISYKDGYVLGLVIAFFVLSVVIYFIYRYFYKKQSNRYYLLIVLMILCPVVLLSILSLPPFKPIFVIRYLLCSSFFIYLMFAIFIDIFIKKSRVIFIIALLIITPLIYGSYRIYQFGEADKFDYRSKDLASLVSELDMEDKTIPIIANNCNIFFELHYYANLDHKVYFLNDPGYEGYGGYNLVADNTNKIDNLNSVKKMFRTFWYVVPVYSGEPEVSNLSRPKMNWDPKKIIEKKSYDDNYGYKATLFEVMDL